VDGSFGTENLRVGEGGERGGDGREDEVENADAVDEEKVLIHCAVISQSDGSGGSVRSV